MSRVAFLWHLHQPDYRDPRSGRPLMPWVRMHALRGYRDLALELVEQDVAMTVNVVPSLLDQLADYAGGVVDRHLELTRTPADALTRAEIREVRRALPAGHPAMTDAHPAWAELRRKLEAGAPLSTGELRDVQVWATLSWFGATALRDFEGLRALIDKGAEFTEGDKQVVLDAQEAILQALPGQLGVLAAAPGPTVSCSPYFHPILPLLVDARHAKRSLPELADEVDFAWPDDAALQLRTARDRVEELLGVRPAGLWPSEGAVSPEVAGLAVEAGFSWLASDDGVLWRSSRTEEERPGGWALGGGLVGFFRDHELSDRIGFQYARRDAEEAAHELCAEVERRARGGLVTVALDGENPWETFADAGAAFRQALYRRLSTGPVRAITLDAAAAEPPVGAVHRLHTGSWVDSSLHIWFGHADDRRAWRILAEARAAAEAAPADLRAAALPHLLAAEGSDWTWWFGEDFSTVHAAAFDALFRTHVSAAWRALGLEPPARLSAPVGQRSERVRPPEGPLCDDTAPPTEDGWARAGAVSLRGGSMARAGAPGELRFGYGAGALWLRLDHGLPDEGCTWELACDRDLAVEGQPATGLEVGRVPGSVRAVVWDPGVAVEVQLALLGADGTVLGTWPEQPAVLRRR